MASFSIAPGVNFGKQPQVWRGRFECSKVVMEHMKATLTSPLQKRPIDVVVDEYDAATNTIRGTITYGPVKGANQNDMSRWMKNFNGSIIPGSGFIVTQ